LNRCPSIDELERGLSLAPPDPALRAHVARCGRCRRRAQRIQDDNALLGALRSRARTMDAGPVDAGASLLPVVPGYEFLAEIRGGGQGIVYRALQKSTQRVVAVKIMRAGPFAGSAGKARFDREVQILGQLKHPSIVTIHDSGQAGGCSYFVMDYIAGRALDEYVQTLRAPEQAPGAPARLPPGAGILTHATARRILRLFADICAAVDVAHVRGILHRDLKPSNIRIDAEGRPHVLDFGLAKVAGEEGDRDMTLTGQFVGSVPWSSPEQAAGQPEQIDIRTDVYALGVLLYQMLTGRFPYDVTGNLRDVLERIQTTAPVRPSAALAPNRGRRWSWRRRTRAPTTRDDELDMIVLKCLQKDPDRRYPSAGELGRDLECYLDDRPIAAKRDSTWYVVRKTLRRHRLTVALVGAAFCVLPAFTLALAVLYRQAARAEHEATQKSHELAESLAESNIERGRLMASVGNVPVAERLLWHEFLTHAGTTAVSREAYWALWELYSQQPCVATLLASHSTPVALNFVVDRPELVTLQLDGTLDRWNLADFRRLESTALDFGASPILHRLLKDGALALAGDRRRISCVDLVSGAQRWTIQAEEQDLVQVALAPDKRRLALADRAGDIRLYGLTDDEPLLNTVVHAGSVRALCFAPDGATLVSVEVDGAIHVWSVSDGRLRRDGRLDERMGVGSWPVGLSIRRDNRLLAISFGGVVHLLDYRSLRQERRLLGGVGTGGPIEFSPDSRWLAAAGGLDDRVLLWNIENDAPVRALLGHGASVCGIAYSADGRYLASTSADGTTRVWEPAATGLDARIAYTTTISDVVFDPHGEEVVAAADDGRVWSSDARTGVVRREYAGHTSIVNRVAITPDGTRIAAAAEDGTIRVWERDTGTLRVVLNTAEAGTAPGWLQDADPHPHQANQIAFHPGGRLLACAGENGNITVWDWEAGACVGVLAAHHSRVPAVAFSPDGRVLASISHDAQLILWDTATHQVIRTIHAHPPGGRTLAFSPNGRTIATGGDDALIRLWDVTTGACLRTLEGHQQGVFSVCFSPDGRWLASGERSTIDERGSFGILLWDVASGRNVAKLRRHKQHVLAVTFSPDGRRLASCSSDHTLLIHDLTYFDRHVAGNLEAALTSAGDTQISTTRLQELRAWASGVLGGN
jgi:WD40 repeat protein/serine/threonine protein kinase